MRVLMGCGVWGRVKCRGPSTLPSPLLFTGRRPASQWGHSTQLTLPPLCAVPPQAQKLAQGQSQGGQQKKEKEDAVPAGAPRALARFYNRM